MEAQERELIKSASIDWSSGSKNWYIGGVLNIGTYEVKIKRSDHDTIDDAVDALKEALSKAVIEFNNHIQK